MNLTPEQEAYVSEATEINSALHAVAGAGKTTTKFELAKRMLADRPNLSILCCGFNKKNSEEDARRAPAGVTCKTMHSLGMSAWGRKVPNKLNVATNKMWTIWTELVPDRDDPDAELYDTVKKIVGLCKADGYVPPDISRKHSCLPMNPDGVPWASLITEMYEDITLENTNAKAVLLLVTRMLELSIEQALEGTIDFDDMLYMPVVFDARFSKFDRVLIDECQDLNDIQRAMLHRLMAGNALISAIGDPNQAIYGFRGANTDSFNLIVQEFECKVFPLSYSFRCPREVVREAQALVPFIKSHPAAAEGEVEHLRSFDSKTFNAQTDIVICRMTRPIVDLAFRLIRRGVPCYVMGSDLGKNLISLIKKLGGKDMADIERRVLEWEANQSAIYIRRGQFDRADAVHDRAESLRSCIASVPANATKKQLGEKIMMLFADTGGGRLPLATIHRVKGLEYKRVFFLDRHMVPSDRVMQSGDTDALQQEYNLIYVGQTRAQEYLGYIDSKTFELAEEVGDMEADA